MTDQRRVITVFGNEVHEADALAVQLVPFLKKRLSGVDFVVMDPTENVEPSGDPWVILDVGMGITDVIVIEDLDQLDQVKGQSVHDYDVYMELRLKEKLKQLPKVKIVLVPMDMDKKQAVDRIVKILKEEI